MTTLYILLGVSLFGIFSMLLLRTYEIKKGQAIFPARLRYLADGLIAWIWLALTRNIARMGHWISSELRLVPRKTGLFFGSIWGRLRNKVDSYFDHFHHHDMNNKGAVSIYWKKVSDQEDLEED